MKLIHLNYGILLGLVCGVAFTPVARGAHAADYLDALATDVSTRIDTADPNLTPTQERALSNASKSLARSSKTLGSDLGLLATAATSLDAAFPEDTTFATLENNALNNYLADAQVQLNAIGDRIGTNTAPVNVSNQLVSAQEALDRANDSS
ncbi:MAG TPA: hypothetical protein VGF13_22505, partial [Verrucomicrobiae bacterium]